MQKKFFQWINYQYFISLFLFIFHFRLFSHEILDTLIVGGLFEKPPIYQFLIGSKKTIIFPAKICFDDRIYAYHSLSETDQISWKVFIQNALEDISLILETLQIKWIRDDRDIIQMAYITDTSPLTASIILDKKFIEYFIPIFGPDIIVVVPSRTKIYIFPKLASHLSKVTSIIRDEYKIAPDPVSLELIEISKKGIHVIGNIQ